MEWLSKNAISVDYAHEHRPFDLKGGGESTICVKLKNFNEHNWF